MKQITPIQTCLNPVRISDADGSPLFVPCGKCDSCRRSRSVDWSHRLQTHIDCGLYTTLFITLTYSNEHLPLVEVDPQTLEVVDITRTAFDRNLNCSRVSCIDLFNLDKLNTLPFLNYDSDASSLPSDFPHFVRFRKGDFIQFDDSPCFAICLRKDVQDFVKRLRTLISRHPLALHENPEVSFFICSEYGPETHRPHYHGLLFFRSQAIAQLCHDSLLYQAWRKCALSSDTDENQMSKFVTSSYGIASYISNYVTFDSSLPVYLGNSCFNAFHLQSKKVPIGSLAFDINSVPDIIKENSLVRTFKVYNKATNDFVENRVSFPLSSWRRVFPEFLLSRHLSTSQFYEIFKRISSLRSDSDIPNLSPLLDEMFSLGRTLPTRPKVTYLVNREFDKDPCFPHELPESIWRVLGAIRPSDTRTVPSPLNEWHKNVPSDIIDELLSLPNGIDLYLFGFAQNRAAVRKILYCINTYDWCRDERYYCDLYLRYKTLIESQKLEKQYSYENAALQSFNFHYTSDFVAEVYPSFVCTLPLCLDAFTDSRFNYLDNLLYFRFGLGVLDFYDSKGMRLTYSSALPKVLAEYRSKLTAYWRTHSSKRNYKHFTNFLKL